MGDISGLREKVNSENKEEETIAYHRNLGEDFKRNKPMINGNINEFEDILFDSWVGYIYLYNEKDKKWLYDNYSIDSDKLSLKSLDEYFKISDIINDITLEEVKNLRNSNYDFIVLQGCGGDLIDWVRGFTDMLRNEGIVSDSFSFDKIYSFENNNLTNIAFPLNSKEIDMGKLAIFRLKIRNEFGAMWLSDYIDNGYIKEINI